MLRLVQVSMLDTNRHQWHRHTTLLFLNAEKLVLAATVDPPFSLFTLSSLRCWLTAQKGCELVVNRILLVTMNPRAGADHHKIVDSQFPRQGENGASAWT